MRQPNDIWKLALGAFLLFGATSFAAPGGHLVEGISDECDALNPIWVAGLRGMPEALSVIDGSLSIRSVDNGDDPYPSAEDMISTYQDDIRRALASEEGPSIVAWVWMPPLNEWPSGVNAAGLREWFGVRVTASDAQLPNGSGLYFPGIYISTDDLGPCLIARVGDGYAPDVTIARVGVAGWWTFGLAWNTEGVTEYYAAPGRVSLTSADLLHVTPAFADPEANRSIDHLAGNFIALRMTYPPSGQLSPDWRLDNFRVYVRMPPELPTIRLQLDTNDIQVTASGGSTGFRYLLQCSEGLTEWETFIEYLGDGGERGISEPATSRGFYRVARPL